MARFYDLFINFMFVGLVIFSLFTWIILFQSEHSVSDPLIETELFGNQYVELNDTLSEFRDQAQQQKGLFESENPTSGFGTILLFSIVSAGKTFNSMTIGLFNTLIILPVNTFGISPIIVGIISTILIITIIIGLWIIYKLGG
jgi:hypothetical protein